VIVPLRDAEPVLAAALKVTVPLPFPLAPAVTVIHAALLAAVHTQPAGIVTASDPVPPPATTFWDAGEIVAAQVTPAWVTVTVWPATVRVPLREVVVVLAAALKVTVPLPLPLAPAVTVIQAALLAAVQAQPAGIVTATEPVAPPVATLCESGATVAEQVTPGCVTVKVWPATVRVPVRDAVVVLAAALKLTDPLPLPEAPAVTVIHAALLAAVHAQPVGIVTVIDPVPPAVATFCEVGAIVAVQTTPACVTVKVWPAAVSVPVREAVEVLAAMLKNTVPLPLPLAPAVIVSQAALLAAVQAHPAGIVTANEPLLPSATALSETGAIVAVQLTPACVTVKVWPAIVIVPVRDVVAVVAATLNVTVPAPLPLAPPVMVIHAALLTAVHAHPIVAVTAALPVPPADVGDIVSGETVGVAQVGVNENVFDSPLHAVPPGPFAPTRDS
jgi:hypothetical protein